MGGNEEDCRDVWTAPREVFAPLLLRSKQCKNVFRSTEGSHPEINDT